MTPNRGLAPFAPTYEPIVGSKFHQGRGANMELFGTTIAVGVFCLVGQVVDNEIGDFHFSPRFHTYLYDLEPKVVFQIWVRPIKLPDKCIRPVMDNLRNR